MEPLNNVLNFPILSLAIFLPTLGAILIWLLIKDERMVRWTALLVAVATFILTLPLIFSFDTSTAHMQFEELHHWIPAFNIDYRLGVDGISMPFIVLTGLLTIICIVSAWNCIQTRIKEYMIAFLILETTLIGVFAALDVMLFYFFWEAMLIPMYLIIGVWGGKNRVYATLKFFLYTLTGSVLMLVALLAMYFESGATSFAMLHFMDYAFNFTWQFWIFIAFFVAFAVKVPMWPVHTWLPDAHTEAPTAGSVILAGILLKMGAYGFLRFSLPMLPDASQYFAPMMIGLSLVAIVYISLVAMMQKDMKRLIAYSSIAHMGFVTLGIFVFTQVALEGAVINMISHGFVAAALFLCVGVLYDRLHTREIADYGGVVNVMPVFAAVMLFFSMANVALPGTSAFIGEIMVLIGTFAADPTHMSVSAKWVAIAAAISVVLSACYTLWMYKRVIMGEAIKDSVKSMQDLSLREFSYFVPLIILVVWVGFYPMPVLDLLHASIAHLVEQATSSKLEAAALLEHTSALPYAGAH
ncbi:MAG: NADH-quinone oxidoreductase subunit M [Mariprofundaceae bacterium]|nr:NADH-quinone oxidoreductase subunit M [Mariprofundaceae bacterium]